MEDTAPGGLPQPLPKLLNQFLDPISPDPAALGVLRVAADPGARALSLVPLIDGDADYRHYLFAQTFLSERMSEWIAETEGTLGRDRILLERIVGLLGKAPVRNLIACARLERLQGAPPPKSADEKKAVTPSREIPFALEAEKACQDGSRLGAESAFLAGLHYDWLGALLKKEGQDRAALTAAFKEGMATAKFAYELGQRVPEIGLGGSLFAAGLLLPLGKPLMACFYPKSLGDSSWPGFLKRCEAAGERGAELQELLEPKRFAVTHAEISCLLILAGELLTPLERAVCFHPRPALLRRTDPQLAQLAYLLSISARLARTRDGKAPLAADQRRWLTTNGLDPANLPALVARALRA